MITLFTTEHFLAACSYDHEQAEACAHIANSVLKNAVCPDPLGAVQTPFGPATATFDVGPSLVKLTFAEPVALFGGARVANWIIARTKFNEIVGRV
jgi:hypothetical protein